MKPEAVFWLNRKKWLFNWRVAKDSVKGEQKQLKENL